MTHRSLYVVPLMIMIAMTLSGCGWQRTSRLSQEASQLIVDHATAQELGGKIDWQNPLLINADKEKISYIEQLGDSLVILESNRYLTAIDRFTGNVRWAKRAGMDGDKFYRPIYIKDANGQAVILCTTSSAYVYNAKSGTLETVIPLAYGAYTSPVAYKTLMIHSSPTGLIWAQDVTSGLVRWRYNLTSPIAGDFVLNKGVLTIADLQGTTATFAPLSGSPLWRRRATDTNSSTPVVSSDGFVYQGSEDQSLYAFDPSSGKTHWRFYTNHPIRLTPQVIGNLLILETIQGHVYGIDRANGKRRWMRKNQSVKVLFEKPEGIYVYRLNQIEVLSPATGQVRKRIALPLVDDVVVARHPETNKVDGLYLINHDGRILKLAKRF